MPKKISPLTRNIQFFMAASREEATAALEVAQTIVAERFGAPVKAARKVRKRKEQDVPLPLTEAGK